MALSFIAEVLNLIVATIIFSDGDFCAGIMKVTSQCGLS